MLGTTQDDWTPMTITGMTCGACVRHVTAALRAVPGVHEVQVDLRAGAARVRHAGSTTLAELRAAVERAGYGA